MEQKRILVTGASGFLGSRVVTYFQRLGQILVTPGHREMDIADIASVKAIFLQTKPDVVIHCAAISDTGVCERNPEDSFCVNVQGSENIAKAAKEAGAKCLICSSDQVYFGSTQMEAHAEEETLYPVNVYGRHKLEAEKRCLSENPDCVCLRLSWMYDGKSFVTGEHGDFLRTFLQKIQAGEELIYPVYDKRGITYVWEVVENLEKAMYLPGGVYNFGAENACSTYDTVRVVLDRLGDHPYKVLPDNKAFAGQPRNLSMNTAKIRQYDIHFRDTCDALMDCLLSPVTYLKINAAVSSTPTDESIIR